MLLAVAPTLPGADGPPLPPPEPEPAIVTIALPGLPRLTPPLGLDRATVNALSPENGALALIATVTAFGAESPLAHCRVPRLLVKLLPAAAVPLTVAYTTLAVPDEPPARCTLTVTVPAAW